MAHATVDTHQLVKRLMNSGMTEDAAEALADALMQRSDDLATKHDIEALRSSVRDDLAGIRTDIAHLETRMANTLRSTIIQSMVALAAIFGAIVTVAKFAL